MLERFGRLMVRSCRAAATTSVLLLAFVVCRVAMAQCVVDVIERPLRETEGFGFKGALDGDWLVVGNVDAIGSVQFLRDQGGQWVYSGQIFDPYLEEWSAFGGEPYLDGDELILGAYASSIEGTEAGAVYVYQFDDGAATLVQELRPPAGTTSAVFGRAIDADDQHLVIGAPSMRLNGVPGVGRVFVYQRDDRGLWSLQQELVPEVPEQFHYFGREVELCGDRLFVSHYLSKVVLEYALVDGVWTKTHTFEPINDFTPSFGYSLAAIEDLLVVGSPMGYVDGASAGTATVFERIDGAWQAWGQLVPPFAGITRAGTDCAIVESTRSILLGAPEADTSQPVSGAVFFYGRTEEGWRSATTIEPESGSYFLGEFVRTSGDRAFIAEFGTASIVAGIELADCNGNGVADACDIDAGTSQDANVDGTPDECEIVGDLDGDGAVDGSDLGALLGSWGPCAGCAADLTNDGVVDGGDLGVLLAEWSAR
jgi:hypothetical protein